MERGLLCCPACRGAEFLALHHETLTTAPCIISLDGDGGRQPRYPDYVRAEIGGDLLDDTFLFICRSCQARYGASEYQPFPTPLSALVLWHHPDDFDDEDGDAWDPADWEATRAEAESDYLSADAELQRTWALLDPATQALAERLFNDLPCCTEITLAVSLDLDPVETLRQGELAARADEFPEAQALIDWQSLAQLVLQWERREHAAAEIREATEQLDDSLHEGEL